MKLGSVCNLNKQSYSLSENWDFVNYLDTGNITENHIDEIQRIITATDKLPSRARRKVAVGDILYSTVRPNQRHYGIVKESLKNMLVSTGFAVITADKSQANNDYLYYYLTQDEIVDSLHAIGEQAVSAYPSIKPSDLANLEIDLPDLDTQCTIASTLSCLDAKIAVNNRINQNLEQTAQVAFEEFLVTQCKDEPMGVLSDIAEINPQRTLKKGTDAIYVEMANLPTKSSFPMDWTVRPISGGMKFTNGDTIMARITPCLENGKTAYINFLAEDEVAFGSTEYIVIAPKTSYCNEMFYFLARYPDFVSYAVGNMNGTSGRQRVSAESIGRYELNIPSVEYVCKFAEIATPIMETIRQNSLDNRHLVEMRDSLLPKLMSGEVRV